MLPTSYAGMGMQYLPFIILEDHCISQNTLRTTSAFPKTHRTTSFYVAYSILEDHCISQNALRTTSAFEVLNDFNDLKSIEETMDSFLRLDQVQIDILLVPPSFCINYITETGRLYKL